MGPEWKAVAMGAGARDDAPAGRGRLHGRLLQVLGGVSAVAAAVALWQFGMSGDEPAGDVDVNAGPEIPSIPDVESTGAPALAASASSESPSESTEVPTSAAPSSAVPTPSPSETTAPAEESGGAGLSCTASLTVEEAWGDSVEVTVEVVNSGGVALGAWEIDLDLQEVAIYHHWNMRDLGDGRYGSEDWNARLDPGENAVAGFQAELGDGAEVPESVPCTAL